MTQIITNAGPAFAVFRGDDGILVEPIVAWEVDKEGLLQPMCPKGLGIIESTSSQDGTPADDLIGIVVSDRFHFSDSWMTLKTVPTNTAHAIVLLKEATDEHAVAALNVRRDT